MNDAPLTAPPLEGTATPPAPPLPLFSTDVDAFNTAIDPDELELRQAREAEKRESGNGEDGISPPGSPTPLAPVAEEPPARPPAPPAPPMIPKPRFDEVNNENRLLRERTIYLEGVLNGQAKAPGETPGGAPPAREPTVADRLAAVDTAIDALATRYDAGEITMVDLEKERRTLQRQQDELREQQLLQKVDARMPRHEPAVADQIIMQQAAETLEAAHPYIAAMTQDQLDFLANIATQEAAAMGKPIGTGNQATMRLRAAVAELTDSYGPRWGLKASPSAAAPKPGLTQAGRDRAAKLGLAANHPPDTGALGQPGGGNRDELTDANIATMTDEMVEALPASVRARLLT